MKYYLIIALIIISLSAERRFKRNKHHLLRPNDEPGFSISYKNARENEEFTLNNNFDIIRTIEFLEYCVFKEDVTEKNDFKRKAMEYKEKEEFIKDLINYAKEAAEEDPYYCVRGIEPKNTKLEKFEVDENKKYDPEKVKYPPKFNNHNKALLPIKAFSDKSDQPLKETIYLKKGYKSIEKDLKSLENMIKEAIDKEIKAKDNLNEATNYLNDELLKHGYYFLEGAEISRGGDSKGCKHSAAGYEMTYKGLDIVICGNYISL